MLAVLAVLAVRTAMAMRTAAALAVRLDAMAVAAALVAVRATTLAMGVAARPVRAPALVTLMVTLTRLVKELSENGFGRSPKLFNLLGKLGVDSRNLPLLNVAIERVAKARLQYLNFLR